MGAYKNSSLIDTTLLYDRIETKYQQGKGFLNLKLNHCKRLFVGMIILSFLIYMVGCSDGTVQEGTAVSNTTTIQTEGTESAAAEILILPRLEAAELNGEPLQVVATTSIIGDVVAEVGGDAIELTTLIGPGQDPHSYQPGARELTAVADAHIIFVNGWELEEGLTDDLEAIGEGVSIVPISANITPLAFGEGAHDHEAAGEKGEETGEENHHSSADPHVWFSIHNVEQWVENVEQILSDLDPSNAEVYQNNATTYQKELNDLKSYTEAQLAHIPQDSHSLVTNHDSLGYLAKDYGFELIGTIIPASSTLSEPSASDLATLIEEMELHGLCTIFTETTVSDTLAQTVAGELNNCDEVKVVKLYTGSVGPPGSGANSYVAMFRANIDAIVEGLR